DRARARHHDARVGPAFVGTVRPVRRPYGARRSRAVLCLRSTRDGARAGTPSRDSRACRRRRVARPRLWASDRSLGRTEAANAIAPRGDGNRVARSFDSDLLGRGDARPGLFGDIALAAADRTRPDDADRRRAGKLFVPRWLAASRHAGVKSLVGYAGALHPIG